MAPDAKSGMPTMSHFGNGNPIPMYSVKKSKTLIAVSKAKAH
jgi:hypothetical protein